MKEKILKRYNDVINWMKKNSEKIEICINMIAYIYIYFNLFYLLHMSIFNILNVNLLVYNIILTLVYSGLLASTFLIKAKTEYKLLAYILILQIFI